VVYPALIRLSVTYLFMYLSYGETRVGFKNGMFQLVRAGKMCI